MQSNVLEYIEETVTRVPDKVAFADDKEQLTFSAFYHGARAIGSCLAARGIYKEAVLIYMEKSPSAIQAFFGTIYGGCYYVPLDEEMPARRIDLIIESTRARVLICDEDTREKAEKLNFEGEILLASELVQTAEDAVALGRIRDNAIDTDPIYVLFTSGSTGVPKGVVGHHRGVIDYIDQLSDVLELDENTVFGNQAPLYFDACMKEMYPTMKYGATTYLIPKQLFLFPIKLVEYLNEHKINTVCWVVSALTMISAFGTFDEVVPEYLHTIAFGSEVFPIKQFNLWKETLPEAKFTNLYGPTECTGMSCYYHAEHTFEIGDVIPIGKPFHNTEILLIKEDGTEAEPGEEGEICIRGTCVTHGYYNNPEKTAEVFVQNPLNPYYPERIYKTGDIGKWNGQGELLFISRKDYQIKHMGHRIELGEIDANVTLVEEVKTCCSIYMKEEGKIVLFYVGDIDKRSLTKALKEKLPRYMLPNVMIALEQLPLTANGKMNRLEMENIYTQQKESRRKKS
ncbi:MAG: amino acid adenylation domain-containing protein [Lachnospiraceae bacterium]|nr:amino acid adenylation domain-containing protein [Lachnospiraceae bacterium]